MMISVLAIMMVSSKCLNGWREVHSLAFAARRADCAADSSSQAHRRAAVSRRRRLDGEGARRATITWLQMTPPNDAEHMLTILLFFNRRAEGARPVHSIRSVRAQFGHTAPTLGV